MDRVLQQAQECFKAGDSARAEAFCRQVLARAPGSPDALRLLGLLRLEGGRAADAIPPLREALRASPADLGVLDALSAALMAAEDYPQAEEIVRRALALDASLTVAHMRLGMALGNQGRWSEAARAFEEALKHDPQIADAHHNLGDALTKLQRPHDAIDCFRRALAINPANPDTHNSLGLALQELRLWGAAIARYERALALDPGFADAHYNLALARLFRRDFEQGWPGYEQRLQCRPVRATLRKRLDTLDLYERLPRWRGPSTAGAGTVAVWAEQGIGDQILFSTLVPELIAAGVPFVYEADPRLLPAYERAFPGARFTSLDDPPREALQRADRVLLAGSLPRLFRRSLADFDRQPAKLLSALPERVAHYRKRRETSGTGLRVALSWRSTRQDWWVRKKNASLADFAPLLKLPGTRFVDVQYGDTAAERNAVETATGVRLLHFDELDYYNDLEEVLAILEASDLVITTSNATAHLAGALGKRTWLLYLADQAPFHYWVHGGDHRALWYPSVEIISAAAAADWRSLLQLAAARLAAEACPGDSGFAVAAGETGNAASCGWLERVRQMRQKGELAEAVEACRRELDRVPGNAQAWSELAHALRWQDRMDEARGAAVRAVELAPALASAWFNLGAVQIAQGETVHGIESYRKALRVKPDFAEAWSNLGDALGATGDKPGEIEAYRRAIGINPQLAPVWSNLGNALLEAGRIGEALLSCRRATELDPDFPAGWNNLGNALRECGEHEEAVKACESALKLEPRLAEAWGSLGAALHSLGRHEEAIRAHRNAIDIQPGEARHYFNLGVTLQHSGHGPEAIASLRRALALDPQYAQAHWDLSFALLGSGQLPEGWQEYEWRWRRRGADSRRYEFAAWDGDASKPRRLLLWAEQGVGDEILYAGMLPDLVSSPLSIALEVDPRLGPLFHRSFPGVSVIPRRDPAAASLADYDCQAPLGSLGRWLRRSFDDFPRHRGYLTPDPSRAQAYRKRLLGDQAVRLVGISWKSANREFGTLKSHSLHDWLGMLRVPRVRFVDLQYGETASEREEVERMAGTRIEHLPDVDLYHDLEGLAALCAACDLVITVSNVTAHVAGALGRPAWVLVPRINGRHWYWFSGRRDSPWYPSMRIFTQQTPGSWREVLDEVAHELAAFVS
ncbi:MAG: tetratricopeptide repeat protein [Betaproteobacteria bacterium]|nr:tetratricopeptide repeat protein [Betaproteobacteria bacterium]